MSQQAQCKAAALLPRCKDTLDQRELKELVKKFLPDPKKNIGHWAKQSLPQFVEDHNSFFCAAAAHTYRLNKLSVKAALKEVYDTKEVDADLYATKLSKAMATCWASTKTIKSGTKVSPAVMNVVQVLAHSTVETTAKVKAEPSSSSSTTRVKRELEQPVVVKKEPMATAMGLWDSTPPMKMAKKEKAAEKAEEATVKVPTLPKVVFSPTAKKKESCCKEEKTFTVDSAPLKNLHAFSRTKLIQ